jgi:hypothetical protein
LDFKLGEGRLQPRNPILESIVKFDCKNSTSPRHLTSKPTTVTLQSQEDALSTGLKKYREQASHFSEALRVRNKEICRPREKAPDLLRDSQESIIEAQVLDEKG